jgi:hypothetical protein
MRNFPASDGFWRRCPRSETVCIGRVAKWQTLPTSHVVEIVHLNSKERHRQIGARVVHQNIEWLKTSYDPVQCVKVSNVEGNCFRRPTVAADRLMVSTTLRRMATNTSTAALVFVHGASRDMRSAMAEYGEWNRKGASLSDVTVEKEYGVSRDFIVNGIQAGKLEYRDGTVWGNPYLRVLRSQLEPYIAEQLGPEHLANKKAQTELREIRKEIAGIRRKLAVLETRKAELERAVKE